MNLLSNLTKPQWDAALAAAKALRRCDPDKAADRRRFRAAKQRLVDLLPPGADARDIITQAVRWDSLNELANAFMGFTAAGIHIQIAR